MKTTFAAVIASLALTGSALATSTQIPLSQRVGPKPTFAGTGLMGMGYFYSTNDLIWADMHATSNVSDFTFMATKIDYSTRGNATVGSFLGTNANMITPPGVVSHTDQGVVYKFTGYIAVEAAGQYDFNVYSDDGFRLKIGGQTVAEFIGERASGLTQGWATFAQGGLYAVEILYFNNGGPGDLDVQWTNAGNPAGFHSLTAPGELYKVIPTPGAAALLGLGGLVASRRRRA